MTTAVEEQSSGGSAEAEADATFISENSHVLLIKPEWLNLILDKQKTIEIRSSSIFVLEARSWALVGLRPQGDSPERTCRHCAIRLNVTHL